MTGSCTGVFGGTFDPFHFGHLLPVREVTRALQLDRVVFVPNKVPPHRGATCASAAHRLEMVRIGIAQDPEFTVDDRELKRPGVSYSVDTLREYRQQFPDHSLWLIVGQDALSGMPEWHRFETIMELANIAVMSRASAPPSPQWWIDRKVGAAVDLDAGCRGQVFFVASRRKSVSATEIRRRLMHGENTSGLLPDEVRSYIYKNHLYTNTDKGMANG